MVQLFIVITFNFQTLVVCCYTMGFKQLISNAITLQDFCQQYEVPSSIQRPSLNKRGLRTLLYTMY